MHAVRINTGKHTRVSFISQPLTWPMALTDLFNSSQVRKVKTFKYRQTLRYTLVNFKQKIETSVF